MTSSISYDAEHSELKYPVVLLGTTFKSHFIGRMIEKPFHQLVRSKASIVNFVECYLFDYLRKVSLEKWVFGQMSPSNKLTPKFYN